MIYFIETQKFKQWWIWLILVIPFIGIVISLYTTPPNFSNKDELTSTIIGMGVFAATVLLIFSFTLKTEINQTGISYRFIPFHFKTTTIEWSELQDFYVREYKPIMEYGGWGIRYSFKNGKAYNTMGNKGLQLIFKNNKQLLIGTQKEEELTKVIEQLKKQNILKANA